MKDFDYEVLEAKILLILLYPDFEYFRTLYFNLEDFDYN